MHSSPRITVAQLFLFTKETARVFQYYGIKESATMKRYCLFLFKANSLSSVAK